MVIVTFIIRGRPNSPLILIFMHVLVQCQGVTGSGDAVTVIAFGYFVFIYFLITS